MEAVFLSIRGIRTIVDSYERDMLVGGAKRLKKRGRECRLPLQCMLCQKMRFDQKESRSISNGV